MLKKLQNLLFEDEDSEEFEDDQEEVIETPRRHHKPAPAVTDEEEVIERPVVRKPAPVAAMEEERMQRIDVTQPIKTSDVIEQANSREESVFRKPTVKREEPKPVFEKPEEPVLSKPGLGITVDEISGTTPVAPIAKAKPTATAKPIAKNAKPATAAYEFAPVISPIFGVDEKDLSAVSTTANTVVNPTKEDANVSKIISPIYGAVVGGAAPVTPLKPAFTAPVPTTPEVPEVEAEPEEEEAFKDFSLDDILKTSDDAYAAESKEEASPLFPDLDLPEEDEEEISPVDNTVVFKAPSHRAKKVTSE